MNLSDELNREAAHNDMMAAVAQMWMDRARAAEQTLAILVHAAGNHVVVHQSDVIDGPDLELIRFEQPHDMTWHFRTRRRLTSE